jgi:pimeloyl-ACP methyl ester carboxylesterase
VSRIVVVPGAAVRSYARPAVDALRARGMQAHLLRAPGAPGCPVDIGDYGHEIGDELGASEPTDILIGLSVGAQVAAVAATRTSALQRLMLVSPTVDSQARSGPRVLGRWLAGGRLEPARLLLEQAPDWRRAGPARLTRLIQSALAVHIEQLLPAVAAPVIVVHAEHDVITSHAYAARLAAAGGQRRLIVVPGATHSWPYADTDRFADLVEDLL